MQGRIPGTATQVSSNGIEGALDEATLQDVLAYCRTTLVTGLVRVHALGEQGVIELRAGAIEEARFHDLVGDIAVERMSALGEGMYEVVQRLPDLSGALAHAAELRGHVARVSLIEIMRHCETNALSCTITLIRDFDRGTIQYRAGEITDLELNGERHDDVILALLRMTDARFRVAAPPFEISMRGRRPQGRLPTAPFVLLDPSRDALEDQAPRHRPLPGLAPAAHDATSRRATTASCATVGVHRRRPSVVFDVEARAEAPQVPAQATPAPAATAPAATAAAPRDDRSLGARGAGWIATTLAAQLERAAAALRARLR